MNILKNIAYKNLQLNKKRNIVTVIGIILSVALITALSSLVVSFKESIINLEKHIMVTFIIVLMVFKVMTSVFLKIIEV